MRTWVGFGILVLLGACMVSGNTAFLRADVSAPVEEDPLPLDSVWKGKLSQRGTHPEWGFIPTELDSVLTITNRDGQSFEAELNESTATINITFKLRGTITRLAGGGFELKFESYQIKEARAGTVGVTGVQYKVKLQGTSAKGVWKYPDNNEGITLEGDFEWTME